MTQLGYFQHDGRGTLLVREVEGWIGTRFVESVGDQAKKGVAADCVSFVAKVLQSMGAIPVFQWPTYVTRSGGVAMLLRLEKMLETIPNLKRIWSTRDPECPPHPFLGDLLLCTAGDRLHHLMLFVGHEQIAHCWPGQGVIKTSYRDPIVQKHLNQIWRVMP